MGLWPMWSFPSAACLGPNPDTLETEKKIKNKQRIMGEWRERRHRERLIMNNTLCRQSIAITRMSELTMFNGTWPVSKWSYAFTYSISMQYPVVSDKYYLLPSREKILVYHLSIYLLLLGEALNFSCNVLTTWS